MVETISIGCHFFEAGIKGKKGGGLRRSFGVAEASNALICMRPAHLF